MTGADPRAEYSQRAARWDDAIASGQRRHLAISNLRLVTAALMAITAWLVFFRATAPLMVFLVPSAAMLALLVVHALVLQRNERADRAKRLYLRGLARLDGRWPGTGSEGTRFGEDHPYARDLDLFGYGSLFQLLSTARTEAGEETLAAWLRGPASLDEILARQSAVKELTPKLDFREGLAILAAEAHVGRTSALTRWSTLPPAGLPAWLAGVFALLAIGVVALVVLALYDLMPIEVVFGWFVLEAIVAGVWRRKVKEVVHRIEEPALDIRLLASLLKRLEREPFASPRLAAIHARLVVKGIVPSTRLRQLQSRVSALESMHNPLFAPVGAALLVREQAAVWIDRWHAENGRSLASWLDAVGELEALSSFASYAYERPTQPFPTIVAKGPVLDATALAHPLIADRVPVPNDVRLGGEAPRVLLVSGSNMSGKSTLLRAVGCNVVLALAGAPVHAESLALAPVALGATLRVEDSLQGGISRFYAEILRIRTIVETAAGPLPLLFLLDEILHGTNSHDRRIGADAIVRSLVESGAIGLVTTHDLALTELTKTLGSRAANVHFEDRIQDGTMVFDYRMRPGVVEHSNALELMRAVGLRV